MDKFVMNPRKADKQKFRRSLDKTIESIVDDIEADILLSSSINISTSASGLIDSHYVKIDDGTSEFAVPHCAAGEQIPLCHVDDQSVEDKLAAQLEQSTSTDSTEPIPVDIAATKTKDVPMQIKKWAIEENISHSALNKLLKILQPFHPDLPLDARTLLQTPKVVKLKIINEGEYYHSGLQNHLRKYIAIHTNIEEIKISFNIDGLPLYNNSRKQAWPILGSIDNNADSPFLIGIWCGCGKPDVGEFLKDFIDELKPLLINGIECSGKLYKIKIRAFICDAPARSYIKKIISHNGYYGCEKCMQRGRYLGRMTFPEIDAPLRTGENFQQRMQEKHHLGKSPLEDLGVNMIDSFGIEYMHLVCLGVMRKLLFIWCFGERKHRLSNNKQMLLSQNISKVSKYICKDFNRKPRTLQYLKHWKATEFRTFL